MNFPSEIHGMFLVIGLCVLLPLVTSGHGQYAVVDNDVGFSFFGPDEKKLTCVRAYATPSLYLS